MIKIYSDELAITVVIQQTSNLDTTFISQLSRGTFLGFFLKFRISSPFLVKNRFFTDLFDEKMTKRNRMRESFIRFSPNFNTSCIAKYNDFFCQNCSKMAFNIDILVVVHIKSNPLAWLALIWAAKTFWKY